MTTRATGHEQHRAELRAAFYRSHDPAFARWAAGYGHIRHDDITQVRVYEMADWLAVRGLTANRDEVLDRLHAADRIASATMWLAIHMVYADRVYLDGRTLEVEDFKTNPEGHAGGSLNMAIAYTGYLAANAVTGATRSWIMGQGHAVSAIDAANVIVDNMTPRHVERYDLSDEGLTRLVRDFYLRKVRPDGHSESPLGSHVNAHTAGGMVEGGYLGFAEIYYPHMPLPGETLVAFLSDGAFEEQRGADWAPRWWRAEDSGLLAPIMIANGRRIDQRTTISMKGGVEWLRRHLRLNNFEPIDIDGCDPAGYAWAIWEMEERLKAHADAVRAGHERYPVPLPYTIAEVPKGFGFPGAGTNAAHNLPIGSDPKGDPSVVEQFNSGARRLWVPPAELRKAVEALNTHGRQGRPRERDHSILTRVVEPPTLPEPQWVEKGAPDASPMKALDAYFCEIVSANPRLRARVGNPDEMRSNRLDRTLDLLKHRVTDPEPSTAEGIDGRVITVLNEEAVVAVGLANKGGINLVATYEAFGVKMLGAIRQEVIFARHLKDAGRPAGWLSVAVISTSHTWENGKNERSHQDPTLAESLMGEVSDVSRVVFPADANSAMAALAACYGGHGQVWNLVIAKQDMANRLSGEEAGRLIERGGILLRRGDQPRLVIAAVGGYQLTEAARASERLDEKGIAHNLVYLAEPSRFRQPRDGWEARHAAPEEFRRELFPEGAEARVILTHTRPEPMLGILRTLDTGPAHTKALGFINGGATFDVFGMLFSNRSTWAHVVTAAAEALGRHAGDFLEDAELAAAEGRGDAEALR